MRTIIALVVCGGWVAAQEALPVSRSSRLKEGEYFVDGRQVVPKGVTLTCQKHVTVVGRGKDATLVIEGGIECSGTRDHEVVFRALTIELAPGYQTARFQFTQFQGVGGLRTTKDKPASGKLELLDALFLEGAVVDLTFETGSIELTRTSSAGPVSIRGTDPAKQLRLHWFSSFREYEVVSGLHGGIEVESVNDARLRWCRVGGTKASFRNCRSLVVEACLLDSDRIEIVQEAGGFLAKTRFLKNDLYGETIAFRAPEGSEKREAVTLTNCYFHGTSSAEAARKERVEAPDHVEVNIKRVLDRPKGLSGTHRDR